MPRPRPPYSAEFRQQMVKLVAAGRTPEQSSREFEPSAPTIRQWAVRAARPAGQQSDGLTTAQQEEVRRLRREVNQLCLEREILSKAAAWFAGETDALESGGSRS